MPEECRDDPEDVAACFGDRQRHFAHKTDAAAAKHEIKSRFDQKGPKSPRRFRVDRIGPVGRAAKDADGRPQS